MARDCSASDSGRESPSSQTIRDAVETTLGNVSVTELEPLARGKNEVYSFQFERGDSNEDAIVKIGTATDDAAFRAEPHLLRRIADETSIPVPRVLGSNSGEHLDVPFFCTERIEGTNLELRPDELPPDVFERVCFEAGTHLGKLHTAFDFDDFGPVRLDDDGEFSVVSGFERWPQLFETAVKANADRLAKTRFSDLISSLKSHAETASRRLNGDFVPVLMHHDYRLANLLLDSDAAAGSWNGETVTNAVLDWGEPVTGHAEYELVQTEAVLTNRPELSDSTQKNLRKRLYEGYEQTNLLNRDAAFSDRRHLYQLASLVRLMKNFETIVERTEADPDARAEDYRRRLDQWADSV